MEEKVEQSPVVLVYGENAIELALEEIEELKANSNIPFDQKYVSQGISFLVLMANEIHEGKRKSCSLKSLVSESFGLAAIAKYNF